MIIHVYGKALVLYFTNMYLIFVAAVLFEFKKHVFQKYY